jgi:hypothetical protein
MNMCGECLTPEYTAQQIAGLFEEWCGVGHDPSKPGRKEAGAFSVRQMNDTLFPHSLV